MPFRQGRPDGVPSNNRHMPFPRNLSGVELEYFIVDVFTDTPLAGNPLAVVFDTIGLSAQRMQAIAREFNLSETTFIQRRPAEVEIAEGVRVRIFTTQEELPFAGHPTLGTASVLKLQAPETVRDETVALALNVGRIPVRFGPAPGESATGSLFGEMTQRDPEFGAELDRDEVAQLMGLEENDLDAAFTPQVVSTGNAFAIVVLHSVESLARLKVNQEQATPWLRERGARWFYVLAPDAGPKGCPPQEWRARMQFYGGEDPATGSAAGPAISYLVARGAVASGKRIPLRQGVEIGRPSDLFLSARKDLAKVTDVRVAGSTVCVASGLLFLP
jgi:trans-2,3-dihydro-3-hydroxyanthranilate isomerase